MFLKHLKYMEEAVEESKKSMNENVGARLPRLFIGAVLVGNKKVILKKAHKVEVGAERLHAEYQLLVNLPDYENRSLSLYTTLEPCCFRHSDSRLPTCVQLILTKKIKEVVIGTLDPHPKISGKSVKMLRKAGIKVTVLENLSGYTGIVQKIKDLNPEFFNFKWE